MAEGVLVFDDAAEITVEGGDFGRSFILVDDGPDVMVFDLELAREQRELTGQDLLVFDGDQTVTQVTQGEPNLILMDAPAAPSSVVLEDTLEPLLVITPGGPPGARGEKGDQGDAGPQGPAGLDGPGAYYQEFNYATPASTWTAVHNQNTFALSVEAVDLSGDPIEGYVRYVDANTIEIDWYYPTAGAARVFR